MADHIFISYSHKDEQFVLKLKADLEARGFEVWIDQEDIKVGEAWRKGIVQAIKDCSAFVIALSPQANASPHVQTELALAGQYLKKIIPLVIEKVPQFSGDIEYLLIRMQYLDFLKGSYARNLEKLVEQLPASAAKSAVTPAGKAQASAPGSSTGEVGRPKGPPSQPPETVSAHGMPQAEQPVLSVTQPLKSFHISSPVEMNFVLVEKGKFLMGSRADDSNAVDYEKPQHTLEIPYDYWIGRTPVTNAQFSVFVKTTGRKFNWVDGWQNKPDHPVGNLSWYTAQDFCRWLNEKAGEALPDGCYFCLPSESEWEKAARGMDGRQYPWGNHWDVNQCNTYESTIGTTTPVGKYSPSGDSPCGAADMAGNVWEWTRSLWGKDFAKPEYTYPYQPGDGRENEQAERYIYRVRRGGSFLSDARYARCAFRLRLDPHYESRYVGFRVVVSYADRRDADPGL